MSNKTHDMEHSADFYHGLLVRAEAELDSCKAALARVEALLPMLHEPFAGMLRGALKGTP
jgi:hypothetical protein